MSLKQWGLSLGLAGALFLSASAEPAFKVWQEADGWHVEIVVPEDSFYESDGQYDQSDDEEYQQQSPSYQSYEDEDEDYPRYQQSYRSPDDDEEDEGDYPRYRDGRDPAGYYPAVEGLPYEHQGDVTSPNGAFPDQHDTWGGPPGKAPQQ